MKIKHGGIAASLLTLGVLCAGLFAQTLTINPPTFPSSNTVRISLSGTQANKLYQIEYTIALGTSGIPFSTIATGIIGQTVFDFTKGTNDVNFFRAVETNAPDPLLVATPVMSPGSGMYSTPTNVTITCATPLASIFYTTNGNTPTPSDRFIASGQSILLNCTTTLKAKAFRSGYTDSGVASNLYQINCAPLVNAGAQQIIASSTTTLQGTVVDDGLTGAGTKSTNWSKVSGPGTVTFSPNANQTNASVTLGSVGVYVLQLVASDGQYSVTSQVTIAWNPTVKVWLTSPANNSIFTVPTNFTLSATGSISGGFSITQIVFYAGSTPIGSATTAPFTFEWKSVPAGNHVLRAVANTTDANNTGLASTNVVNITVNWPTNVGQLVFENTDLRIPVAGEPITVTRRYDSRFGTTGLFGWNAKTDYEDIRIQATSLSSGWEGYGSGPFCIREAASATHLVTVTLSESEKYYFVPYVIFVSNSTNCINTANPDGCNAGVFVRLAFAPLGQGSLSLANQPSNLGMDMVFGAWNGPLALGTAEDDGFGGCEIVSWEPSLADFTFTAPDGTQYGYDSTGKLASRTDRNGNKISYSSTFITYSHPSVSGSTKRVRLNTVSGRIAAIYDPLSLDSTGNIVGPPAVTNQYDPSGNLTNTSRLVSRNPTNYEATSYFYTNGSYPHHITGTANRTGLLIERYEYDAAGRLVRQFDALSNATSYYFDLANRRYYTTNRLGNVALQIFTDSGELASSVNELGAVVSYGYDSQGRRIAETNELGFVKRYSFDAQDNLAVVTNRLGNTNRLLYGIFQLPTVVIDALGRGLTNGYDSKGNLIAATNALGFVTRSSYDVAGNKTAETNHLGEVNRFGYDQFGNLTNEVNGLGKANRYTYDLNGNRLTQTDPLNRTTTYDYDAANRRIRTTYPDTGAESVSYNQQDKTLRETNRASVITAYGYDANGRLTSVTNALGTTNQTVTAYGYDAEGRLTTVTDANNNTTRFEYDPVGRRIRRSLPLNNPPPGIPTYQESFSYDAAGNPSSHLDFNGKSTSFAFDAEGRLTRKAFGGGVTNTFSYDANGFRTNMSDAGGVTSYGYDALNRLTNKASPQGVLAYTYDSANRLLTTTSSTPNGTKTTNFWNAAGLLTNVVDRFGNATRYDYDDAGNLTVIRTQNGVTNTHSYDALNQLTNLVAIKTGGTTNARYAYLFASTGHRTNVTELNGRTVSYGYDLLYRLRSEIVASDPGGNNGSVSYGLDAVGNRLTRNSTLAGVSSTTNTFNGNDHISGEVFDRNGNAVTNANSIGLGFDAEDRLTNYNNGAVVVVYNGDGIRVKKTVGGTTTLFLVDDLNPSGFSQVLEELSATNATPVRLYTHGRNLISQRNASGTTHYFGYDGVGSVRYLTDSSGNSADTYVYDAFGELISSSGATTNSYRFAGEQFDSDLGLYYLRARYLNHKQGRFITIDPVIAWGTTEPKNHAYLYANADPIQFRDPSGYEGSATEQVTVTGIQAGQAGQRYTAIARAYNFAKRSACYAQEGVYIFQAASGLKYVGQSKAVLQRILKHWSQKRLNKDALEAILVVEMPGTSQVEREIIEQLLIDYFRDVKGEALENVRNPVGGRPQLRLKVCK